MQYYSYWEIQYCFMKNSINQISIFKHFPNRPAMCSICSIENIFHLFPTSVLATRFGTIGRRGRCGLYSGEGGSLSRRHCRLHHGEKVQGLAKVSKEQVIYSYPYWLCKCKRYLINVVRQIIPNSPGI